MSSRWTSLSAGAFIPDQVARDPVARDQALKNASREMSRSRAAADSAKGDSAYRFWQTNPALLEHNQDEQARQGRALMSRVSALDAGTADWGKVYDFIRGGNEEAFVRAWSIYPERVASAYTRRAALMRPAAAAFGIDAMSRAYSCVDQLWNWLVTLAARRVSPEVLWVLACHIDEEGYLPEAVVGVLASMEYARDQLRDMVSSLLKHELEVHLQEEAQNVKLRQRAHDGQLQGWYREMKNVDQRFRSGEAGAGDFPGVRGEPGVHEGLQASWERIVKAINDNNTQLSQLQSLGSTLPSALTLLQRPELDDLLAGCELARTSALSHFRR